MKEIEILEKRKPREKHFVKENGEIVARIYSDNIHYLKDNKYEEIDNTLIEDDEYYTNVQNSYKVFFNKNTDKGIMKIETAEHFLDIKLKDEKNVKLNKKTRLSKFIENVKYDNILDDTDLEYKILPTKVKESIIIKNKNNISEKIEFIVNTNLTLILNLDKSISAVRDGKVYFTIEAPYMIDSNGKTNKNIYYSLFKEGNKYRLNLILDTNWLKDKDTIYPIIIDPTITNYSNESSVYDTYIYPGDTNVDRNSQDILKAGVERVNGEDVINRTLIKFDLPVIGTGSQVVDAKLQLVGYGTTDTTYMNDIMEVRRITSPWTENDANWSNMNDKYDTSRIDGCFYANRSNIYDGVISFPGYCYVDLTDLVKRWYTDLPNYGIMIKSNDETYKIDKIPAFYSKNNTAENYNPKPIIQITYRNQNGLENYMKYIGQNFTDGKAYINTYNGNYISLFNAGSTIGGKLPAILDIIYNTNNVILDNNYGYGLGWKFNLHQTIKNITIDETTYLEYVDGDGTVHYFRNYKNVYDEDGNLIEVTSENTYYDEDGLDLTITDNTNYYILTDKNGNQTKFVIDSNVGYLTEITDVSGNKITLEYNSSHLITKITDANNSCINISYETDVVTIISPDRSTILNYNNNKLLNICTINGNTIFDYNDNDVIVAITDVNGKKVLYDYYDYIPYKVKKLTEYGIENNIGRTIEVKYKFSSTTLVDNEGKAITLTFNKYGNVASITNLKNSNSVKNAYGKECCYGVNYQEKNKIASNGLFIKHIKNYLTNTSFENTDTVFTGDSNVEITISDECSLSGNKSLKVVNSLENNLIQKTISVPKGEYYTFSLNTKNDNILKIALSYVDCNNEIVEMISEEINTNQNFNRYDLTTYFPEDALGDLTIKIYLLSIGTAYIDDIQLEDGEVVNKYNYIENSDFADGTNGWELEGDSNRYEIVTLQDNVNALKVNMDPSYTTKITKTINVSGKADDIYTISFWYKNEGLPSEATDAGDVTYNNVSVSFNYNDEYGSGIALSNSLNVNNDEWQFFTYRFKASRDYTEINVIFLQIMNANKLYITNICLYKDERQEQFLYDVNGNISKIVGIDNETKGFKYDINNKLVSITNSKGEENKFEYDNESGKLLLSGMSENGVINQSKHDLNGNVTVTKMRYIGTEIEEGLFRIRAKGTHNYLTFDSFKLLDTNSGHSIWKIEKEDSYYKFKHPILDERYISVSSHEVTLGSYQWDNSLYSFIQQEDNSYLIKCKLTDVYLINNNGILDTDGAPSSRVEDRYKFYIEEISQNVFLEENKKYTANGKFVESETDSILNETNYEIDPLTGLIISTTNAKGQKKLYEYNEKKQLTKIIQGDKITNISYSNNLIDKLLSGTKEYSFNYNDFCNIKSVKVGNNVLSVYDYAENNGNISSLTFGNNNKIEYSYDEFNRLKTKTKMDDEYNYKYNNNGFLAKKISNRENVKYYYDEASRLKKYVNGDFDINYSYDSIGNVTGKIFDFKSANNEVINTFSTNNAINKTVIGDSSLDYTYDKLGRLTSKKINDYFTTNYEYLTNGNRSSLLIKSIENDGDNYSYKYDKLSNITHIYHNDLLENKYRYDDYNQLIEENDYISKKTIRYEYNNAGNIVSKKTYELNTYNLLDKSIYEYSDLSWEDKLTKFNDCTIQYDQIGNPVSIGQDIVLTWKNGGELSSYSDNANTISYEYNDDGIRISKKINTATINYMLEGKKIIYENRDGSIIYYIYNDIDNLIGFKYENKVYYYVKNSQNDIIAIVDSEFKNIAKYKYDGYGNIISITDENGVEIKENDVSHIANINPFRYRSYYYDKETKLYYLNSRYYNPLWCRFINADSILAVTDNYLSNNLYVFALNNPINFYDEDGALWKKIKQLYNKAVEFGKNIYNTVKTEGKKIINKIFGAETSYSKTTAETKGSFAGVTVSGTTTTTTYGKKSDAIITGSANLSSSGASGSVSVGDVVSVGITGNIQESNINVGIFNLSLSVGISLQNASVFIEGSHTTETSENIDVTNGIRVDVSVFTIAAIFAIALAPEVIVPALGLAFA